MGRWYNWKIEGLESHFFKEYMQVGNKYMKKCLIFLVIRKMQIKTKLRYHFTATQMAIIQRRENKCWERCGEIGTLIIAGGDVKYVATCEKLFDSSSKS